MCDYCKNGGDGLRERIDRLVSDWQSQADKNLLVCWRAQGIVDILKEILDCVDRDEERRFRYQVAMHEIREMQESGELGGF